MLIQRIKKSKHTWATAPTFTLSSFEHPNTWTSFLLRTFRCWKKSMVWASYSGKKRQPFYRFIYTWQGNVLGENLFSRNVIMQSLRKSTNLRMVFSFTVRLSYQIHFLSIRRLLQGMLSCGRWTVGVVGKVGGTLRGCRWRLRQWSTICWQCARSGYSIVPNSFTIACIASMSYSNGGSCRSRM